MVQELLAGALSASAAERLQADVIEPYQRAGRELDLRAVAVGAGIGVAGIVGLATGRPDVPIPENIEYNRRLREAWRERVEATIEENRRRLLWAPLRITRISHP